MRFVVDGALYPDRPAPAELQSLADRVDFLSRLCSAWDFGRLPDRSTVDAIGRPDWSEAVEATRLLTSPAYHLLRSWHHLAQLPYLGQTLAYIRDDPSLEHV
ncbi:MAG: hypothetical protein HY049_16930 [Acidobacteria bacterium]|nr:hypothetical protein [Acidobacteriota bacterium]